MLFAGRTATFYAGSTRREFNKFYPAEFMHVSLMFLAKKHNMEVYDLMNWVDEGVAQFKRDFRPRECRWAEPRTKVFRPRVASVSFHI
jgi:lipid II:glycine glycyltransferase (peptidoglycan interpeptide bridge formation enzyme)